MLIVLKIIINRRYSSFSIVKYLALICSVNTGMYSAYRAGSKTPLNIGKLQRTR